MWSGVPERRAELIFSDRVVQCFADRPRGLDELLTGALESAAGAEAIVDGARRADYTELAGRVGRLAHALGRRGIEPGDRVALALGNRGEFLEIVLAVARLGAIAVPINVREQRAGFEYVLGHSGARALLFDAAATGRVPGADAVPALEVRVVLGEPGSEVDVGPEPDLTDGCAEPYPNLLASDATTGPSLPDPERTAVILYTSGTTGRPKGAMLTHLNLVHSVMHYRFCVGLERGERTMLAVPASHVTGLVGNLLATLGVAGCNIVLPRFDAGAFLGLAARERATFTIAVPAMYTLCVLREDFTVYDLSAWRLGGYGGAPMPVSLIAELARRLPGLTLVNLYGSTETTSPSTATPPGQAASHADSVGQAVPCAEVKVMDEAGREVPRGEDGELWIKGPMVVPGYWRAPELGGEAFPGGYWRSGDIGSIDADGWVRLRDRKKDLVNRGGYKVYSVEVENVVSAFEGVVECAVVAAPDAVLGEKIRLFVRMAGGALDRDALQRFCATRLADYKVPDFVTAVDRPLPRNAGGKVLKQELRRWPLTARPGPDAQ